MNDRREDLEAIYENIGYKDTLINYYSKLTDKQITNILENNSNLPDLDLEVIEELFGKTKAKLAGMGAKLGAHAGNMKNKVSTGISNTNQKWGAITNNVGNIGRNAAKAVKGQYQSGDFQAGQIDPRAVGNQQAQQVDPQLAANTAKLNAILPDIKNVIANAYNSVDKNLSDLGLDVQTLKQIDPEIAKAISNAKGWLKSAYTRLG